jgi:hypothetical protein
MISPADPLPDEPVDTTTEPEEPPVEDAEPNCTDPLPDEPEPLNRSNEPPVEDKLDPPTTDTVAPMPTPLEPADTRTAPAADNSDEPDSNVTAPLTLDADLPLRTSTSPLESPEEDDTTIEPVRPDESALTEKRRSRACKPASTSSDNDNLSTWWKSRSVKSWLGTEYSGTIVTCSGNTDANS